MLLHDTPHAAIEALKTPRYEIVPIRGALDQAVQLPRSATVTVTCSPTHGIEPTLDLVDVLAAFGFRTVPHISARMVNDEDHLDRIVDRLVASGVREIYVIGGDATTPAGPYPSAGSLLDALHARGNPFDEIGIAAYPEGHPRVETERLWGSIERKQPLATYLVTQMCFNPDAITGWVAEARRRGITLPVLAGIPGVTSKTHLLRIATRIGVGESARFLSRHTGMISRLFRPGNYEPDDLIDALSPAMADPELDLRGFHIYTFNYICQTENWRQQRISSTSEP